MVRQAVWARVTGSNRPFRGTTGGGGVVFDAAVDVGFDADAAKSALQQIETR